MEVTGSPKQFSSLADLWDRHRTAIEAGGPPGIGFLGAVLPAAVLFADIAQFTELTNEYADEPGVAAFIPRHFLGLIENWAVGRSADIENTFIDKVIGDGVLFVMPGKRDEAVTRALLIARAIFSMAGDLYPARVGVHWGQVCLCDVGLPKGASRHVAFSQVTVMGQAVNLAARLSGAAEVGTVALLAEPLPGIGVSTVDPRPLLPPELEDRGTQPIDLKGFGKSLAVRLLQGRPFAQFPIDRSTMLARIRDMARGLPRVASDP